MLKGYLLSFFVSANFSSASAMRFICSSMPLSLAGTDSMNRCSNAVIIQFV